jgi:PAS domain S-box-containing protein
MGQQRNDVPPAREELEQARAELARLRAECDQLRRELELAAARHAAVAMEHEQKFRQVFETAPIAIALVDVDGRILESNQAFCALLGYRPEELSNLTILDVTHEDDRPLTRQLYAELHAGQRDSYRLEKRYLRKDGTPIWGDVIATTVKDEHGRARLTIGMVDVTQRRLEEAARQASWEQYRTLVELSPDPIVVHGGGRLLYANSAAARLFGAASPAELVGTEVLARVAPDFRPIVQARIRAVTMERQSVPLIEERWLRLDGRPVDVEVAAAALIFQDQPAVQVIARDISGRRQAEAELSRLYARLQARNEEIEDQIARRTRELVESEQKFRRVFETAPIGMAIFDLSGRPLEINQAMEAMLGYDRASLLKLGVPGVTFPEDLPASKARFAELAAGGRESYRLEKRFVRGDGRVIWSELSVALIRDTQGHPQFAISMLEDVTTRRQVEEALRGQVEQEKRVNRLKADLVNAVSHELRTPLTSIMGYAEFLEDQLGGPLSPEQHQYVGQIQEGTRRLQRLVDDLLDFARLEAGTFTLALADADLGRKLDEVVESLRPQARDRAITLRCERPEGPFMVRMDAGRIGQVLLNLIGNALKFTPAGGQVRARLSRAGAAARLEVADTGIGIPPEHLPKLFEKFYQVDSSATRERGGAGLGLSIAKALVEAHGGRIGARSTLGQGSTFWFELPLAGPPLLPQTEAPA